MSLSLTFDWKPISSLLHTDLLFSFFSLYQPITSDACVCSVRVCVHAYVRAHVCLGMCTHVLMHMCGCVMKWAYLYVFVSAPGSFEMGHYK